MIARRTTKHKKSWRDILPVHPAADLFPRMSPDELRKLGEDIKVTGLTSPVVLWRADDTAPVSLLDGINRLDAIEMVIGPVHVDLDDEEVVSNRWRDSGVTIIGPPFDPYEYVISANIHRRHLTQEQRRELIAELLKATPEKSNRQIAETVKASHVTVGAVRAELESRGQIDHVETRTDTRGRQQPAKQRPAAPSKVASGEEDDPAAYMEAEFAAMEEEEEDEEFDSEEDINFQIFMGIADGIIADADRLTGFEEFKDLPDVLQTARKVAAAWDEVVKHLERRLDKEKLAASLGQRDEAEGE